MILITTCIEKALANLMESHSETLQKVIYILIGTVYNYYSSFQLIN